jgi:energy-coupling factor transporter ATP-binding protein EcfA2
VGAQAEAACAPLSLCLSARHARMQVVIIDRIKIRNLGPIESADIELGPGRDPKLADVHVFVGENGTGKTTVLEAIAACLSDEVNLWPRIRSSESGCLLDGTLGSACAFVQTGTPNFDGEYFPQGRKQREGGLSLMRSFREAEPSVLYQHALHAEAEIVGAQAPHRFAFAAFAYAGNRSTHAAALTNLEAPNERPLRGALNPNSPIEDPSRLVRWIAAAQTRSALALRDGDNDEAEQSDAALRMVEATVSDVSGRKVRFKLSRRPLQVTTLIDGSEVGLNALPEGLRSMLSWIADLLLRLDMLHWQAPRPVNEQPFLLLLDEVEVHLHPVWQRRLLPAVQRLFPNAQIIASTHSPFIVSSVADGWIYPFRRENGRAVVGERLEAKLGHSYSSVLKDVFGVNEEFDVDTEAKLDAFYDLRDRRLKGEDVAAELDASAQVLADRSDELKLIVSRELAQVRKRLGTP